MLFLLVYLQPEGWCKRFANVNSAKDSNNASNYRELSLMAFAVPREMFLASPQRFKSHFGKFDDHSKWFAKIRRP
jgi:hypothetical protein